jgi:predicted amino acid-binding ACT domain protein
MNAPRPAPRGGWLRPRDGTIDFVDIPPREVGADVVFAAARFAADRQVGTEIIAWIETLTVSDLVWTDSTTTTLLELLRRANDRSWRFLADVDFFAKLFPDFAEDVLPSHDWFAVESLRDSTAVINADSDTLLLAAFFGGVFADPRRMGDALGTTALPPETIDEIVDLVSGARLLLATIEHRDRRVDGRFFNHIAHGLGRPGIVERSRLLAEAFGRPDPWQHAAMIEITTGVQLALAHPELIDSTADSLEHVLRREAMSLTDDPAAHRRIEDAPTAYVLAHEPDALVRHVRLIEPAPPEGTVRVTVERRENTSEYIINVVCRDRPGLLSRLTAVLAAEQLSVNGAGLATWPDGTVLDSFVVSSPTPPDSELLAERFAAALRTPPSPPTLRHPLPQITLDNSLHPLHSVLRVTGRDQLGLLSAVSHAVSAAGIVIHHAAVRTMVGAVDDDFEVSRSDDTKIDPTDLDTVLGHMFQASIPDS